MTETGEGGILSASRLRDSHTFKTLSAERAAMDPGSTWFWDDEPELLDAKNSEKPLIGWPEP